MLDFDPSSPGRHWDMRNLIPDLYLGLIIIILFLHHSLYHKALDFISLKIWTVFYIPWVWKLLICQPKWKEQGET